MPNGERKQVKIQVLEPEKIISIESKITVREVAKGQLKVIENSQAWKEHQKSHKDARLFVLGAAESSKDLGLMEKTITEFAKDVTKPLEGPRKQKKEQTVEEESRAPGQEVSVKLRGAYASGADKAAEEKGVSYHGGHGAGTVMASCTCGQTFKSDDHGTQAYKINADVKELSPGQDFGAYKKKEPEGFGGYQRKTEKEEFGEMKYGR